LPRPITHDLLRTVLEALDAQLLQVEILELRAETYFAQLVLRGSRRQEIRLDSRPSDAVALAVRTGAAIFVHEQVIEKSQSLPKENLISADKDDWAAILEAMDPEDFGKYPM